MIQFREANLDDGEAIIELNAQVVQYTSPMDRMRFEYLFGLSHFCIVAEADDEILGFIIVMKQGAQYDSKNFEWFSKRLNSFVYIDRIVIAEAGRGKGLGTLFYDHVIDLAKADEHLMIAAEIDLNPPNENSLEFHRKNKFLMLGESKMKSGKILSMQVREL